MYRTDLGGLGGQGLDDDKLNWVKYSNYSRGYATRLCI